MEKIFISVLTPTWNRARLLTRVWDGLNSQTMKCFEWIIADDGSTDDTVEIVKKLAEKSDFPVKLIKANVHIGKARMDNEAIAAAQGEFVVWNDSDDFFLPDAFEIMVSHWKSLQQNKLNEFIGVMALCGELNSKPTMNRQFPSTEVFTSTINDIVCKDEVMGDFIYLIKSDVMKINKFPEVDFLVPEGSVWSTIGESKILVLPKILKVVEYNSTVNSVTGSVKMSYNRGYAVSTAISERNYLKYRRSLVLRFKNLVNYLRYSIHGEISISNQLKLWLNNTPKLWIIFGYPFAIALAVKDRLQGKVVKTHRDFIKASESVQISNVEV